MTYAYTPGLQVKALTRVRKRRILPIKGEVTVQPGDVVSFETIVANTKVPGNIEIINLVYDLGCYEPEDIIAYVTKKEGMKVEKDDVIAETKGFFGFFKTIVRSPVKGTVENISTITGSMIIREVPVPVEVSAYIPGIVVEVLPGEGVVVEVPAAFIQGIFGIGGETHGELKVFDSQYELLDKDMIGTECAKKILVCVGSVNIDGLRKAVEVGAKAIIVGGVKLEDLIKFLGQEIMVITGEEEVGLTLIITEGFGNMRMADRTFTIFKSLDGKQASVNGATQIRAGVIRPEIIVPKTDIDISKGAEEEKSIAEGLEIGALVRVIRDPYFGSLGYIRNLPVELQTIETGSEVRVMEVELENGENVVVPRANVEIIEE